MTASKQMQNTCLSRFWASKQSRSHKHVRDTWQGRVKVGRIKITNIMAFGPKFFNKLTQHQMVRFNKLALRSTGGEPGGVKE
jgi:hypothetical protein